MSRDRIIYFDKAPSREEVQHTLRDYLGMPSSSSIDCEQGGERCHFMVCLPGANTHPASGLPSDPTRVEPEKLKAMYGGERWFEISLGDKSMDVITRQQDPLVNAIADGYAQWAAFWWKGRETP